ncbi:glycoside hydrolase family 3 C-terminal domain-containing protein [Alloyangia pacifica]|uniref:glycoside hydrolase family 3 C-terminal domain-containing protein n=1 Tax=Alloyangia pacifica TaxID=311180 RepID=UPI001CD317BD|nr:glycoside hydrolase family 3 C-terminal domain-containing protein [Alloyangia pacifica]MCA0994963.1 glycoside hydrolase family 3 C-terminal domain-containing protein [Alloyangia pacifica]
MTPDDTCTASDREAIDAGLALATGQDYWSTPAVEALGLRSLRFADGPHGLRLQNDENPDHLGLERSLPATCFPPAVTLSCSWDEALVEEVGAALGREAAAAGVDVILGPGLNLKRSPLCGRNFEYYSEDPLLSGTLAGAAARGIQSTGVAACLKHFAANTQEHDRHRVSAEIDMRTLREMYLRNFEIAFETSGAWSLMTSYNRINGTYTSEDSWLLGDVLREDWGFDGLVMSDWGGVYEPVAAFNAGVDVRMPGRPQDTRVREAHADGRVSDARVEQVIERMRLLAARTADKPVVPVEHEAQDALVRRAASASAVLLVNDGTLPLDLRPGLKVAVIGELARKPRYQGAGSSRVNPRRISTVLDVLSAAATQAGAEVDFAPGYTLQEDPAQPDLIAAARDVAARADVVILVLGLPEAYESEGRDRSHIDLPEQQLALIEALRDLDAPRVVAMCNGAAVTTAGWRDDVQAIVEFWLTGQAHGEAITDVLTGAVNPGGRLSETIPKKLADTPSYLDFPGDHEIARHGERTFVGYRWYDAREIEVDHPFGHGLSYTSFAYEDLTVEVMPLEDDTAFRLSVSVRNTGPRSGSEVVQLYVTTPAGFLTPERELRGWAKVDLVPGEVQRVEIVVTRRRLAHWHEAANDWVFAGGQLTLHVGASSRDIRLTSAVTVPGHPLRLVLGKYSSLGQWLDHDIMGPRLGGLIAERGGFRGRIADLMDDPAGREGVCDCPLASLSEFPGVPLVPEDLDALCEEAAALA